ncbi:amino acid ABC transporter permease [Devosia rhodophyticola]|uniref:Amino acid ABC transporter permease n=1 Tax=Devosia rhodophyticola TaxID=3026423 RepID=A0ABY7YX95_9HYPH|nr:amino acid ABC transporter permease [Devosia rhodophyticola]WDR06003.1 amino acid ABC transporter permease [Devosia rhodophyticola]
MHDFGIPEMFFLLQGLKWTVLLTAISFVGGGIIGLAIALARVSRVAIIRRAAATYIALFQGTPLLMQLFVIYYGLALMQFSIDAWLAVSIAYTAHASAFLGDIWRGTIQSLPAGQTEASNALAIGYVSRMRDVILPQALKISLPATIGFAVQLTKGTSLAAIVGFVELARAGQIVSNLLLQPLLVYGIVGVIYFFVCWPMSIFGSAMEKKMSLGR